MIQDLRRAPATAEISVLTESPEKLLFRCSWDRVLFIHYEVDPAVLQPQVPFPLETWHGAAYVSLVAFTLGRLRFRWGPPLTTHGFLNVRTYLPGRGIYFLAEWLPHPLCVFLGPRLYGLPYRYGRLDYRHRHEEGRLEGRVTGRGCALHYTADVNPDGPWRTSAPGSLEEFACERYVAHTERRGERRLFHVAHPPWRLQSVEPRLHDESLPDATGPWFRKARRVAAHYSPGFDEVGMGRPLRCA
jgi:uncharacterized protein YqjF (DUF2071 family)